MADRDTALAWRGAMLGDDGRPHEQGRLMLEDLVRICRANERLDARKDDGSIDPLSMAHAEGARRVWLVLKKRLFGALPAEQAREGGLELFDQMEL